MGAHLILELGNLRSQVTALQTQINNLSLEVASLRASSQNGIACEWINLNQLHQRSKTWTQYRARKQIFKAIKGENSPLKKGVHFRKIDRSIEVHFENWMSVEW